MKTTTDIEKYQSVYSEKKLQSKLARVARWAGQKVIYAVLLLYYVLQSPDVSTADKGKIYGALGYFILPTDLLADFIPVAGYADDLAALILAIHAVSSNITPEIKAKAKAKLATWFKNINDEKLNEIIKG